MRITIDPEHVHDVQAMAIAPTDGRRVLSLHRDGSLCLWDLDEGRLERAMVGAARDATCVAITPDGRRAVLGTWAGTLQVWNLTVGYEEHALQVNRGRIGAVAIMPDGRHAVVLSARGDTLEVWDLQARMNVASFTRESDEMWCCAVAAVSGVIMIGQWTGLVHFLRLETIPQ
jgi:WD40 repeat protein